IAARGYPLSALFPATMSLYRSLGWELAGARDTAVIPARSLLRLSPPDTTALARTQAAVHTAAPPATAAPLATAASHDPAPAAELRRAGPEDAAAVIATLGRVHEAARDCGPITRDAAMVANWLADRPLRLS